MSGYAMVRTDFAGLVKSMSSRSPCVALLVSLLLPASWLSAQAPASLPPAQTRDSGGVIHSTTHLVEVNVLVRDKKGNPVRGLTKDDFTILDEGQQQKIELFYGDVETPVATATPPLPPNVYTNRFAVPGNVSVILFDALNTTIQDQQYARDQVIKVLHQLSPDDHVAIYLLTRRLQILHDFTFDLKALLHAVDQFSGIDAAHVDSSLTTPSGDQNAGTPPAGGDFSYADGDMTLAGFLAGVSSQRYEDYVNVDRALITANAFEAIADHLANIPGRKSVVWISGSFPLAIGMDSNATQLSSREIRSFEGDIKRATRALNQSDIAVYPVDARGLLSPSQFGGKGRPITFGVRPPTLNTGPDQNNFATMELLANRTGGKSFYNQNDLEKGVRFALNDGKSSYSLGFYPTHGNWDGKFHEIKVVVKTAGTQVRYRKGYFATPDPVYQAAEVKADVETAVWSPVESTGLRLQVMVNPSQTPKMLELKIGVDTRELRLVEEKGLWKGAVDLAYVQLGPAERSVLFDYKHLNLSLEKKTYDALMLMGTVFTHEFTVAPKTSILRVVVRDASSGALGTVTIPLEKYLAPQTSGASQKPPAQ